MELPTTPPRRPRRGSVLLGVALATLLAVPGTGAQGQPAGKIDVLRIGSSGSLTGGAAGKEKTSLESLRSFIKDETGFNNEIIRQHDWRELADKLAKGQLHIG